MDDKERTAVTHLPPPPESPSDAGAESTLPPPGGVPPAELRPESEPAGHGASDAIKLLSTDQLIALYTDFRKTQADLLSETGGFASLLSRRDERLVASFAKVVEDQASSVVHRLEPRFQGIESKLAGLERAYAQLKLDTDRRMTAFETEIRELKEQRGAEGAAAATPA